MWSDGSALFPVDPLLRRAAWVVTWCDCGNWVHVSGTVPSAQTVGRAELCAAVWAYTARHDLTELFIDDRRMDVIMVRAWGRGWPWSELGVVGCSWA